MIAVVAIARQESEFVQEWIAYHRLLGADHIFIYDDDYAPTMPTELRCYSKFVTIVPWHSQSNELIGRNRQTKAYMHATKKFGPNFDWMAFIDIDEFIVLRKTLLLNDFLLSFSDASAISLNWHVFGHCGYFQDPPGPVTYHLVRRMRTPSVNVKSIVRPSCILNIESAHTFDLTLGAKHLDANGYPFTPKLYPGRTKQAHINHYQCRSFLNWIKRAKRGDVNDSEIQDSNAKDFWKTDENECLKKFVEKVAFNKNEFVDEFMRKFTSSITSFISASRS